MKMYELQDALINLARASELISDAEDRGEDVTELQEELAHHWGQATMHVNDKVDGVIRLVKNLQAEAKACKEESDKLSKKAKSRDKQVQFIKDHLIKPTLDLLPSKKVKTIVGSAYFMNTEAVEITDQDAVPANYKELVETIKIDKKALKFDLKEKEEIPEKIREAIPGCFLKKNVSVVIR